MLLIWSFDLPSFAQKTDSAHAATDSVKVDKLIELSKSTLRMNVDSSMIYARRALQLASEIHSPNAIAEAHRRIGMIYTKKSQFDSALFHFDQSKEIYLSSKDSLNLGYIYNNIARVYNVSNQFSKSLAVGLAALRIAEQENNIELQGMIHNNLGILYRKVGEYDIAISHYFKSIDFKMQIDSSKAGPPYTNIGLIKIKLKEYDEARTYLNKALEIDIEQNDTWGIANNRENLGMLSLATGDLKQARAYFQQALDGFREVNTISGIANNHNLLAEVYIKEENYEAALTELEKAKALFEEADDQLDLAAVWKNIADCNYRLGHSQAALQQAHQALQLAQNINALEEAVHASGLLFYIYGNQKEASLVFEYAKLHMAFKDSLFNHQKLQHIAQLESQRELSDIEQQNTLLIKENELQQKELEASTLKLQRQKITQYALVICLIFAVISGAVAFQYFSKKMKTIKLLQQLNAEIQSQKEHISQQAEELQKVNGQMKNMNESLEELVLERTKKIESQNQKLREYAFSNSHEVRAPLANLLALIELTKKDQSPTEHQEILESIHFSATELDFIITKVNKLLKEEKL